MAEGIYYGESEDIREHVKLCASRQNLVKGGPQWFPNNEDVSRRSRFLGRGLRAY